MLNWTGHEISAVHKIWNTEKKEYLALGLSDDVFIMLINVKMPTIVGILTFMSRINFVLSWVNLGAWSLDILYVISPSGPLPSLFELTLGPNFATPWHIYDDKLGQSGDRILSSHITKHSM